MRPARLGGHAARTPPEVEWEERSDSLVDGRAWNYTMARPRVPPLVPGKFKTKNALVKKVTSVTRGIMEDAHARRELPILNNRVVMEQTEQRLGYKLDEEASEVVRDTVNIVLRELFGEGGLAHDGDVDPHRHGAGAAPSPASSSGIVQLRHQFPRGRSSVTKPPAPNLAGWPRPRGVEPASTCSSTDGSEAEVHNSKRRRKYQKMVHWLACDKCQKWRCVTSTLAEEFTNTVFYCTLLNGITCADPCDSKDE